MENKKEKIEFLKKENDLLRDRIEASNRRLIATKEGYKPIIKLIYYEIDQIKSLVDSLEKKNNSF